MDKAYPTWQQPPSTFQRWIGNHPYLWVLIVIGAVVAAGANRMMSYDSFDLIFYGSAIIILGIGALVGALLMRRRLRRYDASVAHFEIDPGA